MSDQPASGSSSATSPKRLATYASLAAFIALILPLQSSGASLTVYSLDVPAWLVGLVCYLLGAVAMWGQTRK